MVHVILSYPSCNARDVSTRNRNYYRQSHPLCLLSVYLTQPHETRSPRPSPSVFIKYRRWEVAGNEAIIRDPFISMHMLLYTDIIFAKCLEVRQEVLYFSILSYTSKSISTCIAKPSSLLVLTCWLSLRTLQSNCEHQPGHQYQFPTHHVDLQLQSATSDSCTNATKRVCSLCSYQNTAILKVTLCHINK